MIATALLSAVEEKLSRLRVERVVIGIAYTAVLLSDGRLGLAATPREGRGCTAHSLAGSLAGRPAWELAQGLTSVDP